MIEMGGKYRVIRTTTRRKWNPYAGHVVEILGQDPRRAAFPPEERKWWVVKILVEDADVNGVYHEDELEALVN